MTHREKRKIIVFVFLLIIIILGSIYMYNRRDELQADAKDASYYGIVEAKITTKEKLKDLDHIYEVLEDNYPFFAANERKGATYFLKNRRKHRRLIKNTKTDAEFLVAIEMILSQLNNPHTNILYRDDFTRRFKYRYKDLERKDQLELFPYYEALTSQYSLYRYTFDGDIEDIELYEKPNLELEKLEDGIGYIRIKSMADFDLLEEDYIEIKNFLEGTKDFNKLIIDIRGNIGGQDTYWKNLVELLAKEPLEAKYYSLFKDGHRYDRDPYKVEDATVITNLDSSISNRLADGIKEEYDYYKEYPIRIEPLEAGEGLGGLNFKGDIYLLVDGDVFAQGENFASFSKDTGFAKLVGERTGGNRIFEKVPIFDLKSTRFTVSYSRELGINEDGSINMVTGTEPDTKVEKNEDGSLSKKELIKAVIKD